MHHPFGLNLSDLELLELDFEEHLVEAEAEQVQGGTDVTTLALGEEGGTDVTTLALGEEGGNFTTKALGEEGGDIQCISAPCPGSETGGNPRPTPKPPKPPVVSRVKSEHGGPIYTKARHGLEGGGWPIHS